MIGKLDITQPLRLIGIQIFDDTSLSIRKALRPGWYPFIKCENNPSTNSNIFPKVSGDVCPKDYYKIYDKDLPHISISAIVGKNGSGKSTLLDILYRILNNFAEAIFLKNGLDETKEIKHAYGVHARLFFEQDGVMRFVETNDIGTFYYEIVDGYGQKINLNELSEYQRTDVLNSFFYTISINYSIYSFNPNDLYSSFSGNGPEAQDNEWINSLFHKNDGYFIPIVLTPYREDGEMRINNENKLAQQRLNVLSILFHSQKKEFIDDYIPSRFFYRFDYKYKEKRTNKLYENPIHPFLRSCQDRIIEDIENCWEKYLADRYNIVLNPVASKRDEITLFYLAYKTFKICSIYPAFREMSYFEELLALGEVQYIADKNGNEIPQKDSTGNYIKKVSLASAQKWFILHEPEIIQVIKTISDTNSNHITLKIQQCIQYLVSGRYYMDNGVLDVDSELLEGEKFETFEEVMLILPPSFFESELKLKKKFDIDVSEVTFSSMSSGERQFLYAMSYVFYHIKNIASIKKNGKRVVGYHHINLIFDEAELYYHPEYQRQFVRRILDCLAMCHINRTNIRSINILIVTHSPFILSDIPDTNILFLTKESENSSDKPLLTLGANIYDLLKGGFFLDYAMGDFIQGKLNNILDMYYAGKEEQRKKYMKQKEEFDFTVSHLGEDYLRQSFQSLLDEVGLKIDGNAKASIIRNRIEQLEREKQQLQKELIDL